MSSSDSTINTNTVIYLVAAQSKEGIADRVRKVASLKDTRFRIELFTSAPGILIRDSNAIPPFPNPFAILNRIGLASVRRHLDSLWFPSSKILYVQRLLPILKRKIKKDLRQESQVVLVTCVPHHDLCILGRKLKQQFPSLRWIIDWADLWSYDESYRNRIPRIYRNRSEAIEQAALAEANCHVTTNPLARKVLVDKYHVNPKKVIAIPHPYESSEIAAVRAFGKRRNQSEQSLDSKEPVQIAFLGSLFKPPKVDGQAFLEILSTMRSKSGLNIELHVYGSPPGTTKGLDIESLRSRHDVTYHNPVPHTSAAAALSDYDYLLVLLADLDNCKIIMHSKLPLYLIAGPPILAIVPEDSYVAEVVRNTGVGHVLNISGSWEQQFVDIISKKITLPVVHSDESAIAEYDWQYLSQQWIRLFLNQDDIKFDHIIRGHNKV